MYACRVVTQSALTLRSRRRTIPGLHYITSSEYIWVTNTFVDRDNDINGILAQIGDNAV